LTVQQLQLLLLPLLLPALLGTEQQWVTSWHCSSYCCCCCCQHC